jgi:hypothetical protein
MQTYFAWVGPGVAFNPAVHNRFDEQVFQWDVSQTEGDLASARIDIINPREGLLNEERDQWAWLSVNLAGSITPLFYGRIVGAPEDMQDEIVRLQFVARPEGYEAAKVAAANALRVHPYYDPIWVNPANIDDPDTVLEARPALWHVDRITHAVTASNIIVGEGNTIELGPDDIFYESLDISFRGRPANRVTVEAEVFWDQAAVGTVDVTQPLLDAFAAAGSAGNLATTFTGEGLERTWPLPGARIGAGWSVGATVLQRVDGSAVPQQVKTFQIADGGVGAFPLWSFRVSFPVNYEIARSRSEVVRFSFEADTQRLFTEPSDDETITVNLASTQIGEPIDESGATPLRDIRWSSYFLTDRGKRSLEYLITLAQTRLLFRARAVDVTVEVPFDRIVNVSCRDNVTITDYRLPGGLPIGGKVASYALSLDGDSGQLRATVTAACTIGKGNALIIEAGAGDYVDAGYVGVGYQSIVGGFDGLLDDTIAYANLDGTPIDDDGIDLTNLNAANSVQNIVVVDGEAAQTEVINAERFEDVAQAITALNDRFTEVGLCLTPLNGGPFRTEFDITVSDLMVPKTIDLEAEASS